MKKVLTLVLLGTAHLGARAQNYFQQQTDYVIRVKLDDQKHRLTATEEIRYTNHSPDVLKEMYFHLWPNAYSSKHTAWAKQMVENGNAKFHQASKSARGYITGLDFKVDGRPVKWQKDSFNPDVARLDLSEHPIYPGQTVVVTTPFVVQIPKSFSRLGRVGQQYQITQWYPKPAVYDRLGWHAMPYLDQGEFYSEYGTFDVYIETPKEYVVGATGELQSDTPDAAQEIEFLRERERRSRELLSQKLDAGAQPFAANVSGAYKTLHFRQDRCHDFAWFCDKQYYVLSDKMRLPQSGREVKLVAMFNDRHKKSWSKATDYLREAVHYYSTWVGEYPYNVATAVDGALSAGGGMEYPTITVVSADGGAEALREVIIHEVGHNWFYGILGSNERAHPWMDEGLNTFYEYRTTDLLREIEKEKNPAVKSTVGAMGIKLPYRGTGGTTEYMRLSTQYAEGNGSMQPIDYPAHQYRMVNYALVVYVKSVVVFRYLEDYLGRERFDRAMQEYYRRWQFKHPYPADMQAVFEETTGEDLAWFFKGMLVTRKLPDFAVKKHELKYGKLLLTLAHKAEHPAPARVLLTDAEGKTLSQTWTRPFLGETVLEIDDFVGWQTATVNAGEKIAEKRIHNNAYRNTAMFRKTEPVSLRWGWSFPKAEKRTLFVSPILGANARDGFMLGGLVHYNFFPKRPLEFHLMPMYGFGAKEPTGSAGLTYRIWGGGRFGRPGAFRKVELRSRTSYFSGLLRWKNFVEFHFRQWPERTRGESVLTFAAHHVNFNDVPFRPFTDVLPNEPGMPLPGEYRFLRPVGELKTEDFLIPYYVSATWRVHRYDALGEVGWDAEAGYGVEKTLRLAFSVYAERKIYKKILSARMRYFVGGFPFGPDGGYPDPKLLNGNVPWALQLRLSGGLDPFGEAVMPDRFYARSVPGTHLGADFPNNPWLARQVTPDQGGFRIFIPQASTASSMLAANYDFKLLGFVSLFADLGVWRPLPFSPSLGTTETALWKHKSDATVALFVGGVRLTVMDVFAFNVPVVFASYSDGFAKNGRLNPREYVNFSLNFAPLIRRAQL